MGFVSRWSAVVPQVDASIAALHVSEGAYEKLLSNQGRGRCSFGLPVAWLRNCPSNPSSDRVIDTLSVLQQWDKSQCQIGKLLLLMPWRGSYSSDSLISLFFNPWTGHTSALKNPAYRGFIVNHQKPTSACWFSPGLSLEMVEAFPSAVCAWVCLPEDAEDHDSRDQRHEGDAVANGVADLHLPKKFALMKQQRHDHMLMYTCAVWALRS